MGQPLHQRDGFTADPDHPLVRALRALRERHGLQGAVLVTFDGDRMGVDSSGADIVWGGAMRNLADKILAAIDDGMFDPEQQHSN